MKSISCSKTREYLAGYREGWLSPDLMEKVRTHLEGCPKCELELKRDISLSRAIEALPERSVDPVTWGAVYASKKGDARVNQFHGKRRLAYAFSVCCVLFLFGVLFGHLDESRRIVSQTNMAQNGRMAPTNNGIRSYIGVDAVLSAADVTSDPNRAVMLFYESKNR